MNGSISEGDDVDVIVVAHNAGDLLVEAVASAVDQAGAERVWVDVAASQDGSVQALRRLMPKVHVVAAANEGFAVANNRGIAATHADFVLLLNPDAVLLPGALGSLLATAQTNRRAAIVAPQILNLDGTVQAGSVGRFPTLTTTVALHLRRLARRFQGDRRPAASLMPSTTTSVDWVTGAAMLVRRAEIDAVGPLDEAFFLYYEDVEWCRRMHDHGWDVILDPAAQVAHHRGGSTASDGLVAEAYRTSFYRYCDIHGLWGLKTFTRCALVARRLLGGRG
jgi:GT2 family glycosyltransferase